MSQMPKELNNFLNRKYLNLYRRDYLIILTHNLIFSQRLYDEHNLTMRAKGYETEYYFCNKCSATLIDIIWPEYKGWDPLSCDEMVIKNLLE